MKVATSDLMDVVGPWRNLYVHDPPFAHGTNGVAKAQGPSRHRHPLDSIVQRVRLQERTGDKVPAYSHPGVPRPDVVNGETHALGVEAESVAAEESRIRERSESRLALDPGVNSVHVASKLRFAIFVVANQGHLVRDHGTVGTPVSVEAVEILPVFSPHVGQEQVCEWPSGPLGQPLELSKVVWIASSVQVKEFLISRLSFWSAVIRPDLMLEETIVVKQPMNLFGKPFPNGKPDLEVRAGCLELFNWTSGCAHAKT